MVRGVSDEREVPYKVREQRVSLPVAHGSDGREGGAEGAMAWGAAPPAARGKGSLVSCDKAEQ